MKKTKLFWVYAIGAFVLVVGIATAVAQSGVLFVANDRVGIGVSTPESPLHIQVPSGEPNIRLETLTASGVRFELKSAAGEWEFIHGPVGNFNFNRVGVAGNQFIFTTSGNLIAQGTVSGGSSRDWKTDFGAVESQDVLSKVADLPLSSWRYKNGGSRHFGPMAEDFHAAFGLGLDEKHLAPADVAGVALAAVQGLNETVAEKDQRIRALEQQMAELQATLATLTTAEN